MECVERGSSELSSAGISGPAQTHQTGVQPSPDPPETSDHERLDKVDDVHLLVGHVGYLFILDLDPSALPIVPEHPQPVDPVHLGRRAVVRGRPPSVGQADEELGERPLQFLRVDSLGELLRYVGDAERPGQCLVERSRHARRSHAKGMDAVGMEVEEAVYEL